ncbi:hypothetical protein [Nakamurella sp. PAMC28650]|uniref:hypothetical protein n=1 Tax=Nakamurella sp. PAMC28650 TaxID=2762325 RepID=UPI00164E202B|nr:hypothetical protein [Nakamurella sp. PAMC28650]QNK82271.1 hypothetical protein H7F38_05870 [Nakamurella sp. PAMC28650]
MTAFASVVFTVATGSSPLEAGEEAGSDAGAGDADVAGPDAGADAGVVDPGAEESGADWAGEDAGPEETGAVDAGAEETGADATGAADVEAGTATGVDLEHPVINNVSATPAGSTAARKLLVRRYIRIADILPPLPSLGPA